MCENDSRVWASVSQEPDVWFEFGLWQLQDKTEGNFFLFQWLSWDMDVDRGKFVFSMA